MKKKQIRGIMLAAPKSGSGKTVIASAFLEVLKNRNMRPCAFKCGPDYIDPMFHRNVTGIPSYNLDSYFLDEEQLRELYVRHAGESGIAVVEGAMGLYDGIGGIWENGSAYHIACCLQLPVILIVDAHGMGRSILPLLTGFLQYDKEKQIAGIILNRVSKGFYMRIAPLIEQECAVKVFGFIPNKTGSAAGFAIKSRHLGLELPGEIPGLQHQIRTMAEILEACVSIDDMIDTASRAGICRASEDHGQLSEPGIKKNTARIGVARDEAFCFYYEENLSLLERNGAQLVYFSPLHDQKLPEALDGILLGGGYPELYAKELEKNESMREAIRRAAGSGMPSIAECGGFMYLHETLEDEKQNCFQMCGIVPGKCFYTGKLIRFGYIEIKEKQPVFLDENTVVKGHEFHYYDSEAPGWDCLAEKPGTGQSWSCMYNSGNTFWGFPHLYYPSNPGFAAHFIKEAELYHEKFLPIF